MAPTHNAMSSPEKPSSFSSGTTVPVLLLLLGELLPVEDGHGGTGAPPELNVKVGMDAGDRHVTEVTCVPSVDIDCSVTFSSVPVTAPMIDDVISPGNVQTMVEKSTGDTLMDETEMTGGPPGNVNTH